MLAAKAMGYDSCPMIGFDPDQVAFKRTFKRLVTGCQARFEQRMINGIDNMRRIDQARRG